MPPSTYWESPTLMFLFIPSVLSANKAEFLYDVLSPTAFTVEDSLFWTPATFCHEGVIAPKNDVAAEEVALEFSPLEATCEFESTFDFSVLLILCFANADANKPELIELTAVIYFFSLISNYLYSNFVFCISI